MVDRRLRGPVAGGRDDAGAGPGRLAAEIALVDQGDADAFLRQEIGRGQADDAAAEDQHVRRSAMRLL